jgi:lipid A ethanolaminephosphotransferase
MFYVSDHGESLGEKGLYLHGLPKFMAPDCQRQVPAVMWFGNNHFVDQNKIKAVSDHPWSHDLIFHTMLSLMRVETQVYKPELDMLHNLNTHKPLLSLSEKSHPQVF